MVAFEAIKILVVEDNASMAMILEKMLEHIGIKRESIYKCSHGEEALRFFKKTAIDVVLTDWNMPVMNGVDLVRALRRINKEIPIIMETSKCSTAEVMLAREIGITAYLVKPFQTKTLKEKLEEVLS